MKKAVMGLVAAVTAGAAAADAAVIEMTVGEKSYAVSMPFAYLNARSGGISIKIFAGLMIGITFYALNNIFSFLGVINTWSPVAMAVLPPLIMLIAAAAVMWWVEKR